MSDIRRLISDIWGVWCQMPDEDERKVFEYIMQRMLCKACNRITMIVFAFLCERAKAIQIRVCVDTHRFQKWRKKNLRQFQKYPDKCW